MGWKDLHILTKISLVIGIIIFLGIIYIFLWFTQFNIKMPKGNFFKILCIISPGAHPYDQYEGYVNNCYQEDEHIRMICGGCVYFANLNSAKKNPIFAHTKECVENCACHMNDDENWHSYCSNPGFNIQ